MEKHFIEKSLCKTWRKYWWTWVLYLAKNVSQKFKQKMEKKCVSMRFEDFEVIESSTMTKEVFSQNKKFLNLVDWDVILVKQIRIEQKMFDWKLD
jgi:hypothetical protein